MSAYNPPTENVPIFDSSLFRDTNTDGTLTIPIADKRYLRFPIGQGQETLPALVVQGQTATTTLITSSTSSFSGQATINNTTLLIDGASGKIEYDDATQQNSAFTGAGALSGAYTNADITIDTNGKITAIANGSGGVNILPLNNQFTGTNDFAEPITLNGATNTDRQISNVFYNLTDSFNMTLTTGTIYATSGVFNYDNNANAGRQVFAVNDNLGVQKIPLQFDSVDLTIQTTNPPTCSAVQPASTDSSTKIPTTAWVQSAILTPSPNSITINPSQVPNASGLAGIKNPFNSSGFSAQFFSNVNYSYLNIWVDFQGFNEGSVATYQDSLMVQVDIVWDGASNLTASYGNCNFLCKLFPKRIFASPQWGSHYAGVSALTNNSYTGLGAYNSTNVNYAPYGRQYWCYNIQGSQTCSVYGGASYCLFQFPNPMGAGNFYCASTSIRVLDSTIVQTNPNPVANCGVKVYTNFQA